MSSNQDSELVDTSTTATQPTPSSETIQQPQPLASTLETPQDAQLNMSQSSSNIRAEEAQTTLETSQEVPPAPNAQQPGALAPTATTFTDALNENIPGKEEKDNNDSLVQMIINEYNETCEGVPAEGILGKFRTEYDKMFKALLRSRDHINRSYEQYGMMYNEYVSNQSFTQEAMKTSVIDQQTLRNLRAQIKKASDILEASNKREESLKEELRTLKSDIVSLQQTMKQGVGLSAGQERTLNELIAAKETASKELESEIEKIVALRNDISDISERIRSTDNMKRDLERDIFELKERNAQKKTEIDIELRNKDKLERDLRELRASVALKTGETRTKQDAVDRLNSEIAMIEGQIKTHRTNMDKLAKDRESLEARAQKLKQDCADQSKMNAEILEENKSVAKELSTKEAELHKLKQEARKCMKIRDQLNKKNRKLEEARIQVDAERRELRVENDQIQNKTLDLKRAAERDKKIIEDLKRELDILQQNLEKTNDAASRSTSLAQIVKQSRHNLELEIERYARESASHLKKIRTLQEQKDHCIAEAARLQALAVSLVQQIREKELEIFDYKKKMVQNDTKLKHQQNLYEAVQSDRNLHSKQLLESQKEITEMKRRLKIMNFQIAAYKEDILAKENDLKKESTENEKLRKDVETINGEIKTLKHQNELAQAYIRCQLAEEAKLNQFVKEADMERSRQEKALQVLMSERDNLSSQLIHQNDELSKVYNKLKTNQFSLLRSEKHYNDRLKVIAQLRTQINNLRQEKISLDGETKEMKQLRHRIARLTDDLTTEQTRAKALEEELKYPVNVHRWRKLEGSNPKTFELIQLLHTLQKKLIDKTSEDAEKGKLITQKEELYLHMKNLLAKQTGPESIEQLHEFQHILKEKILQLKHMSTELNMYRAKVAEYQYQIGQLDKGFDDMKRKYKAVWRAKKRGGETIASFLGLDAAMPGVNKDTTTNYRMEMSSPLPELPTKAATSEINATSVDVR